MGSVAAIIAVAGLAATALVVCARALGRAADAERKCGQLEGDLRVGAARDVAQRAALDAYAGRVADADERLDAVSSLALQLDRGVMWPSRTPDGDPRDLVERLRLAAAETADALASAGRAGHGLAVLPADPAAPGSGGGDAPVIPGRTSLLERLGGVLGSAGRVTGGLVRGRAADAGGDGSLDSDRAGAVPVDPAADEP